MAGQTKYRTYDCKINWAKVFEHNRDMGSEDYPLTEIDGQYSVEMEVDDETKAQMIADGIPEEALGYPMFKPSEDGGWLYRAKRPHIEPKMIDQDTGKPVVMGPPNVVDWNKTQEAGEAVKWDSDVLIGNGSEGKVKLRIWSNGKRRKITLMSVAVSKLVEYESEGIKW